LFKNILLSNIDIDVHHQQYKKLLMTNFGYFIALLTFVVFSFFNIIIAGNTLIGVLEIVFIFPTLYGIWHLRKTHDIKMGANFASYLLFSTILIVLFFFEFKDGVMAWALLFPFIAMNLCDAKKGLKLVILFNMIVYLGAYFSWMDGNLTSMSLVRFINVSIVISVLVYFYELSIEKFFEKQQDLNNALRLSEKEARELSITDSLTKLYNKRQFDIVFGEEYNRAKRANEPFILAIIDVDNFKLYNDTYGHDEGNLVLEKVGKILKMQTLRSGDYAFRVGGEEFALILQSHSSENIENYFNALQKTIEDEHIKHINNEGYDILTVSIGAVSIVNYENITMTDVYKQADKNLYAIKNSGRNGVLVTKN
jgi:diguanylate cyclase (GGDEF)-like protein